MKQQRSPLAVILLTIVTCGIYYIYWLYQTALEVQSMSRNPGTMSAGLETLLCIICPPYVLFWYYKYGKMIYEIQLDRNVNPADDNAILYLILTIFALPVVASAIMQSSWNRV